MNRDNKKDIEYSVLNCFKEICRLQELESKGQYLTPKEENWLEQAQKDLDNLIDLLHREKIKRKYEYSGRYDENGKRILEKGETVDSCNIISKSTGKDTWRRFFQLQNSPYALGVDLETYKKNHSKLQYVKSPFVEFEDVLRDRTYIELTKSNRGNQRLFIDRRDNILISYQLGDVPEEFFRNAISEIPYNETLHDIMEIINKIPEPTWDMLRPYSKDYIKTQSLPSDEITDEKKPDVKAMKKIIEDTTKYIIEDLIELERIYNVLLKISKEKLTNNQREAFEIKLANPDRTFKEIGEILDIPESTFRDNYNRAIKRIRKYFNTL